MPQPAIALEKYLSTQLPAVKENLPAGGGATGERKKYETPITGVSIIEDFQSKVQSYIKTLPEKPLDAHPAHPFPHFLTALPGLPKEIRDRKDIQQYLRQLPLAATAATLCALSAGEQGIDYASLKSKKLDAAGYESDGGEEVTHHHEEEDDASKPEQKSDVPGPSYGWKYNKSPLGSGEFLLVDEKDAQKFILVVRCINSSAFAKSDWDEFVFEGPYHYNIKNKASWYHARIDKAVTRLGCRHFVFTDYQRWVFGVFTDDHKHVNITQVFPFSASAPTILEALVYWSRTAIGAEGAYEAQNKDVSSKPAPFDSAALGRRGSVKQAKAAGQVSLDAESDIDE